MILASSCESAPRPETPNGFYVFWGARQQSGKDFRVRGGKSQAIWGIASVGLEFNS